MRATRLKTSDLLLALGHEIHVMAGVGRGQGGDCPFALRGTESRGACFVFFLRHSMATGAVTADCFLVVL